jgi:hypothetical protein
MASILGVETLQHTNGTDAATIKSDGTFYPTGGVVQVVQAVKSDYFTTTSTTWVDIPSLAATITPKSTSSKIMVEFHIGSHTPTTAASIKYKIVRDGTTDVGVGLAGQGDQATAAVTVDATRGEGISMKYLDSPATTSATTYKIQMEVGGGTVDINRRPSVYGTISTITLTEIAG